MGMFDQKCWGMADQNCWGMADQKCWGMADQKGWESSRVFGPCRNVWSLIK